MATAEGLAGFSEQTEIEIAGTRFEIRKLPATQARRTWRELLHAFGQTRTVEALGNLDFDAGDAETKGLLMVIQGVLALDVDYLERLQGQIFAGMTFQNKMAATPQPVGPAQDTAFMDLEPVDVDELLIRGLAVNFTRSLRRAASRLGYAIPDTPPPSP